MELEGVRQRHAGELNVALVHALLGAHLVVDLLDVDRRDVVGEQHELVREDLGFVLVLQGLGRDDPQLQQARHEGARARKGLAQVGTMDTRIWGRQHENPGQK